MVISLTVLTAIALLLVMSAFIKPLRPLTYDEIDYVLAAMQPFYSTWTSKSTLDFIAFLNFSAEKIGIQTSVSEPSIEESQDNFILRHFHGPLFIYPLTAAIQLGLPPESTVSIVNSCIYVMLAAAIVFYLRLTIKTHIKFFLAATLALAIIQTTEGLRLASETYNVHTLTTIVMLKSLYLCKKWMEKQNALRTFLLGFSLAALILITPTALFIIFLMSLYVFLHNRIIIKNYLIKIGFSFLAGILLMNPGIIYSFDIGKSVLMYIYRIFFIGKEYTELRVSAGSLLISFAPVIILSAVSLVTAQSFAGLKRGIGKFWCEFWGATGAYAYVLRIPLELFVGVGYILLISPFIVNSTYLIPGIILVVIASVIHIVNLKLFDNFKILTTLIVGVPFLLLSANEAPQLHAYLEEKVTVAVSLSAKDEEKFGRLDSTCAELTKSKIRILSFDSNFLRLHAPSCVESIPIILDYDGTSLLARDSRKYRPLESFLESDSVAVFVSNKRLKEIGVIRKKYPNAQNFVGTDWELYILN